MRTLCGIPTEFLSQSPTSLELADAVSRMRVEDFDDFFGELGNILSPQKVAKIKECLEQRYGESRDYAVGFLADVMPEAAVDDYRRSTETGTFPGAARAA